MAEFFFRALGRVGIFLWAGMCFALDFLAGGCSQGSISGLNSFSSIDSIEFSSFTFTPQISKFMVRCGEWMVIEYWCGDN